MPRDRRPGSAGSTMEEAGFDRSLDDRAAADVHARAARLVPALGTVAPADRWTGLRPLTSDSLPVLGPHPRIDDLWMATGYGRNGILLAPLAGRALAAMIAGEPVDPDWLAFSPGRFAPSRAVD